MKLSAVLICKNEEEVIDACLTSLAWFDEVIVVDTGSEDSTAHIAMLYPNAEVFTNYQWNDDFSEARNYALSKATGEWVMQIDADHVLATGEVTFRGLIEQHGSEHQVLAIELQDAATGSVHHGAWLFENRTDRKYVGAVHEVLNAPATKRVGIKQVYTKSPSHNADPDRNLRILKKSPATPRNMFYLGRELYERKQYSEAVNAMNAYLTEATWAPEICEAFLTLARCHWFLNDGTRARQCALDAVRQNPMFKEALLFLGELHYEPWKSRWAKLAEAATNEDVLFIRS